MELPGIKAQKSWGELVEDRGNQIPFSALGQQAPLDEKKKWDPDFAKRLFMKAGTLCIQVKAPYEPEQGVEAIIACLSDASPTATPGEK